MDKTERAKQVFETLPAFLKEAGICYRYRNGNSNEVELIQLESFSCDKDEEVYYFVVKRLPQYTNLQNLHRLGVSLPTMPH